jgi:hypothetical protein
MLKTYLMKKEKKLMDRQKRHLHLIVLNLFLLLLTACANQQISPNESPFAQQGSQNSQNGPQSSCPAQGSAQAARMPDLKLGNEQMLIYSVNEGTLDADAPKSSALKRHDTSSGKSTEIVKFPGGYIEEAQVSSDGKWILFTEQLPSHQVALLLIRVDGQHLQLLYCSPGENSTLNNVRWSPDQKLVVFSESDAKSQGAVKLLKIASGEVSLLLQASPMGEYGAVPIDWIDNNNLYMTGILFNSDAPRKNLYRLELARGMNQEMKKDLFLMADVSGGFDFDKSEYDTRLFLKEGDRENVEKGPSVITSQAALGGPRTQVYESDTLNVRTLRAISNLHLLLIIDDAQGGTSGVWLMHTSGTDLQRLIDIKAGETASLNTTSQYVWSDVSRDGNMYAVKIGKPDDQTLFTGFISGGSLLTVEQVTGVNDINAVGWTKM